MQHWIWMYLAQNRTVGRWIQWFIDWLFGWLETHSWAVKAARAFMVNFHWGHSSGRLPKKTAPLSSWQKIIACVFILPARSHLRCARARGVPRARLARRRAL